MPVENICFESAWGGVWQLCGNTDAVLLTFSSRSVTPGSSEQPGKDEGWRLCGEREVWLGFSFVSWMLSTPLRLTCSSVGLWLPESVFSSGPQKSLLRTACGLLPSSSSLKSSVMSTSSSSSSESFSMRTALARVDTWLEVGWGGCRCIMGATEGAPGPGSDFAWKMCTQKFVYSWFLFSNIPLLRTPSGCIERM